MNDSGQGAGSTPSMAEHGVSTSVAEPIFNIKDLSELENELLEENMFMVGNWRWNNNRDPPSSRLSIRMEGYDHRN